MNPRRLGLRPPGGQPVKRPPMRAPLEHALQLLRHLQPYAAPRLPDDWLRCFDQLQRQVRPLPPQAQERRRVRTPIPPGSPSGIPAQRRPHPSEVMRRARR